MNLVNRFTLFGYLSEIRIDLFRSHTKIKLSIDLDGYNINCYSTISKRFNLNWHKEFESLISQFSPKQDGWVYINKNKYYQMQRSPQPSCLFLSGNISPTKEILFFNFEYCKIIEESIQPSISIEIEGRFISSDKFLNIVSDSPRIFTINSWPTLQNDKIYYTSINYNPSYKIKDEIIYPNNVNELTLLTVNSTNKKISEKKIQDYMLEWKILNDLE